MVWYVAIFATICLMAILYRLSTGNGGSTSRLLASRTTAVFGAVVVLCVVNGFVFVDSSGSRGQKENKSEIELSLRRIMATKLGAALRPMVKGEAHVIVVSSHELNSDVHDAMLEGLLSGLRAVDEVVKVFIDEDTVNQSPSTPPARQLFTAAMLDAAVLDHDRTNVLVSFVDVPPDLFHYPKHDFRSSHNSATRRKIGRKAMVFGVLLDNPYLLGEAIETGEITVCIIPQYRFQYTETLESLAEDPDGAFNSRYIMVTKDNVRDVFKEHQQMFKLDNVL